MLVSVEVITPVELLYDAFPLADILPLTSAVDNCVFVSVDVITPVEESYWALPEADILPLTSAVDNCVLVVVSVELIVPSAAICTLVPAVNALTTFTVSVTSAEASIAFNLEWSASVNVFESVAASTAALISAFVWSAVALASIAFNLLWSALVKLFCDNSPSWIEYVVLLSVWVSAPPTKDKPPASVISSPLSISVPAKVNE